MNTDKPLAAISLDLDNLWSYLKTHGDPAWQNYPSYFNILIPRVLELLRQIGLKITFFIVGMDALREENKKYIKQIVSEGHEVGNHSFSHEPWFSFYSKEKTRKEIADAEMAIVEATGESLLGFRGPGFSLNGFLCDLLAERQYLYDTSSLPTFLGPLARAYYFKTAVLNDEQKDIRRDLFGNFANGLRPVKPYLWKSKSGNKILEIPVTTIPFIKFPFHLSYLMYIARYSESLMRQYLNLAILLCRLSRTPVNFLLHPLDLIGWEEAPELAFFPAMDVSAKKKKQIFTAVVSKLMAHFKLVRLDVLVRNIFQSGAVKVIQSC